MNRRDFLTFLAPAAALIVAPELILPRKTFFLPPASGWGGSYMHDAAMAYGRMYDRTIEGIINPQVMAMMNEFATYGSGVIKINNGSVIHVPLGTYERYEGFSVAPEGWPSEWPKT